MMKAIWSKTLRTKLETIFLCHIVKDLPKKMLISHLAYKAAQTLWTLKDPPSVIQSSNANKETNHSNAQTTRM